MFQCPFELRIHILSMDGLNGFTGTRTLEVRPGYEALDIPSLERSSEPSRWLCCFSSTTL